MTQLREDVVVPESVTNALWCGRSGLRTECFVDNGVYYARDFEFEIRFRQYQKERCRLFAGWQSVKVLTGWQNVPVFALPPVPRCEAFVSVPGRSSRYDSKRLSYVTTTPLFLY